MPSIAMKDVTVDYATGKNTYRALASVSLTVPQGTVCAVIGPSGCGKSTMLKAAAGLLTPTAGTVILDGQDIHARRYDRSILRRKVGIVFQYPECQLFETTVEKDVAHKLAQVTRQDLKDQDTFIWLKATSQNLLLTKTAKH